MSALPPLASRASSGDGSSRAAPAAARASAGRTSWLRAPTSIRWRLTGLIFAITLAAVSVVYFYVAPSLGSSLRDQRLATLATEANKLAGPLTRTVGTNVNKQGVQRAIQHAAVLAGSRVTLFGISTGAANGSTGIGTYYVGDSSAVAPGPLGGGDLQFPIASEAALEQRTMTATETGVGGEVAEAAKPLYFRGRVADVVVFSAPLNDVQRSVSLIRRKILIAGAIALAIAGLGGFFIKEDQFQGQGKIFKRTPRVLEYFSTGNEKRSRS